MRASKPLFPLLTCVILATACQAESSLELEQAAFEPGIRIDAVEGESLTVPVRSRQFKDWQDVYAFAIDELGAHPVHDEEGAIVAVRGVSLVTGDVSYVDDVTGVSFEDRELVSAMLGGSEGVFYVGGEPFVVGDVAGPTTVTADTDDDPTHAYSDYDCVGGSNCEACTGNDCISGHSWYTNYWVYKSVGSRTEQSSGGYGTVSYACCPSGTLTTVDGQKMCKIVTEWLPPEPPLFPKPIPLSYDYVPASTCSYQTTQNQLGLTVLPKADGLPQPTYYQAYNTRKLERSEYTVGGNVDFAGVGNVEGICGLHGGSHGGLSLTRASATFEYCDLGL